MEKQQLERIKERDRLFLLKPSEIEKLSHSEQYQRMRYEREIEAYCYIQILKSGIWHKEAAIEARKQADNIVANWQNETILRTYI